MSFSSIVTADIRLCLLLLLREATQYSHNEYVLKSGVAARFAHHISSDKLRTELQWLDEQGLIKLDKSQPSVFIATLTARGDDVATGRSTVPGVQIPQPD